MAYEPWIAFRYLTVRRREKFISITTIFSILGVALGVMALIVVLGVMSGFEHTLMEKIIGVNPHIVIEPHQGIVDTPAIQTILEKYDDVVAFSPFVQGQGLIRRDEYVHGVMVWGVDPVKEGMVTDIASYLTCGQLNDLTDNGVFVGKQLALKMGIFPGDEVTLVSPFKNKPYTVTVRGTFASGMYEYDLNLVVVSLAQAQDFFNVPGLVSGIGIRITDPHNVSAVACAMERNIPGYRVRTWIDSNKNLFSAIKIEKLLMFIILTLIVLVGGFNIISTLVMVVMEKTKDIGVLKTLGATNASVAIIFIINGMIIGTLGTLLGTAGGLGCSWFLARYPLPLPPNIRDIYYTDHLPVYIDLKFVMMIAGAAIGITLLATVYPALRAAALRPVEALRYE